MQSLLPSRDYHEQEGRAPYEIGDPSVQLNHLLAALPGDERRRTEPHLAPITIPLGHVVYESSDHLSHIALPTTAIISMRYVVENGASAEIAVAGRDGLVGAALFMGARRCRIARSSRAGAMRSNSAGRSSRMSSHVAVRCSACFGVRRASVTEPARKLQEAGLIRQSRGKIEVLDRAALEHHVCECYQVVREENHRLPSPR